MKVSRHHETNGNTGPDRVELTLVGKGPVVRAEADGSDKYAAFDVALGRLLERIRRAKDRRKVHRGQRRPTSLREATDLGFSDVGVQAAAHEVLEQVRTGSIPVVEEGRGSPKRARRTTSTARSSSAARCSRPRR